MWQSVRTEPTLLHLGVSSYLGSPLPSSLNLLRGFLFVNTILTLIPDLVCARSLHLEVIICKDPVSNPVVSSFSRGIWPSTGLPSVQI